MVIKEKSIMFCIGILLLMLISMQLFAKVGVKVGLSTASNAGVEEPGFFSTLSGRGGYGSFLAGLTYSRDLADMIELQGEVIYTVKGDRTTLSVWNWVPSRGYAQEIRKVDVRYEYLEFPLLLEVYTSRLKRCFHLIVGAYYSYLLDARVTGLENINKYPGDSRPDDYSAVKHYDLGWIIGFGVKAKKTRRWRTDIQFRLESGNTDIARPGFHEYPMYAKGARNIAGLVSIGLIKGR